MTERGSLTGRAVAAATAGAVTLTALIAGSPGATAASGQDLASVRWRSCPAYSDDVIRTLAVTDGQRRKFRALLGRMECGTVSVPLDYRKPRGRQITIAITRVKAVDRKRRLGSLALNPGGPGASGYLFPLQIASMDQANARLNERYDLIGFDPRGVGYSTKADCPAPQGQGVPPEPGPLPKETAKLIHDSGVAANKACGDFDPAFLGQLTTLNSARDLDRVRIALGERKLSYLGISWGTWLGAVYRSTFPGSVGRMFLDSVAPVNFRLDDFEDGHAAGTERHFARMAAWIAKRDGTYGLGSTVKQVRATVLALGRAYDETPRHYSDWEMVADGATVAILAIQSAPDWPQVAQAFKEMREESDTAPPALKKLLGQGALQRPPAGAPERFNATAGQAVFCNEDPSRLGFSDAWATYERRLKRNPITGRASRFSAQCAGWPLPVQKIKVRRGGGSLVLAGHRYEAVSLYEWTKQMHAAIGGTIYTVADDVHGSVMRVPDCAAEAVSYFNTGRIDRGCDGTAVPAK
ncbi:alpha/beta fold hydrolase [Nonomuraea gerenzanensis]|uniref:alpha/beta fold hydrolase n=1 Tax=Nonomuraea gerenzanensis TaxID=93944 RepID=UPI001CD9EFB9|nr:alpha/beta fold hydrolase [Nonomuraea gerenzanensis]UBU08345.1 alpha/beta hydrolase [Nonomuraea gerenzanensis]